MQTEKAVHRLICSCESDQVAICRWSNWCLRLKLIWRVCEKLIDSSQLFDYQPSSRHERERGEEEKKFACLVEAKATKSNDRRIQYIGAYREVCKKEAPDTGTILLFLRHIISAFIISAHLIYLRSQWLSQWQCHLFSCLWTAKYSSIW